MSYKNTILSRPGEKYPFLLATEADGIPLTRAELETLKFEIEVALMKTDGYAPQQEALPPYKRAGAVEMMSEMNAMRRNQLREEVK